MANIEKDELSHHYSRKQNLKLLTGHIPLAYDNPFYGFNNVTMK